MEITIIEKGCHGVEPMLELLESGQITNVQFLLHTEKQIRTEYERYCSAANADPYDEDVATRYLSPWMKIWKAKLKNLDKNQNNNNKFNF